MSEPGSKAVLEYGRRRQGEGRYLAYWGCGIAAVLVVMALCLLVGADSHHISFGLPNLRAEDGWYFLRFRLVRVTSAALVGAALAAAGVLFQGLLRNPLADPYVLGISTGSSVAVLTWVASFTAVLTMVEHGVLPQWVAVLVTNGEAVPALIGALVTCVAVFAIARANSSQSIEPLTLLLVGVVVSAFNGALIILINSLLPYGVSVNITTYLIGNIDDGTGMWALITAAVLFLAGWAFGLLAAGQMNIAALSDVEATSLGVRLGRLRTLCFIAASVMTAAAISIARAIGFVGLICPHICRLIFGPDQRQLIVTAPFCGAVFLMLADALVQLSRPWLPLSLPVGVVTALAGGPFFLVLLRRRNRREVG